MRKGRLYHMGTVIKGLEPEALGRFFEEISAIPRSSGSEQAVSEYLMDFARQRGLEAWQDEAWNVVIRKPGSPEAEDRPAVMLQGHLDMVCEKRAGVDHDFQKEGPRLIVENGVLRADGTTLGGDNGAAVALMLAVLDDGTLVHPPLECVFTTQEEIGLLGAGVLDKSRLQARTMINLDSEEEGIATVSCAGGMCVTLRRPVRRDRVRGVPVRLELTGLLGGHSGTDIHRERGNACKLMARLLRPMTDRGRLLTFAGGSKDNAIPRECAAEVLFLTAAEAEAAAEQARAQVREIAAELPLEPDFDCAVTVEAEREARALSPSESRTLVRAVCLAPNGVRRRDPRVPEAVVASLNLGIVRLEAAEARLVFSPRSSVDSLQRETESLLALLAEAFGFSVETAGRYPGWAYAEHSPVRGVFRDCYRQLFGEELRFEHMHAGLECGLFAAAMPGLDAIAVGPTILGVHTPDERMPLDSFQRTYRMLTAVLERLAKE